MTALSARDYARILTEKQPDVSPELALRIATAADAVAGMRATVVHATMLSHMLLKEFGMKEGLIQTLCYVAGKTCSWDTDAFSEASDASLYIAYVFQAYAEMNGDDLSRLVCTARPVTMWDIVCACPAKVWNNLLMDSIEA